MKTSPDKKDKDLVDRLVNLAQLDMDAVLAYEHAIAGINAAGDKVIADALESFQDDHFRHIDELDVQIALLGGTPPPSRRDLKGVIIEGMTAALSAIGTRAALLAMIENEALTNAAYQSAINSPDASPELARLLERNLTDEKRHMLYLVGALKSKFGIAPPPRASDVEKGEQHFL